MNKGSQRKGVIATHGPLLTTRTSHVAECLTWNWLLRLSDCQSCPRITIQAVLNSDNRID
jgi:hypothetical protein